MKSRGLIVAVLVLGALGGALYWSNRHPPVDDATKAAASTTITILPLNRDDISKVEIVKKDGDELTLAKSGAGKWDITAPKPFAADQDQVSTLLSALAPVTSDRVIDEKTTDLKAYGLADPLVKVSATAKDGKSHTILIGDDTPTGAATYAMVEGDPRVVTVSSFTKSSLDKSVNDLRDKHLLPVDYDKTSKVELAGPKLDVAFASSNGQWSIENPKDVRPDTSKIQTIVDKLRAAVFDPNTSDADSKKNAAAFASGAPVTTVKVTDPSGSQDLQVRKDKDAYYAKSSVMPGAYKIANDLGDAIAPQSLDDFRDKKLLDAGVDEPSKIELQMNGKTYSLSRSADDWMVGGKKMEFVTVEAFLNSMRQLSASKFVTSGFTTPSVTLTVTSGDGKRVEKVLLSKDGSNYVAKRDNDPLLYQVAAQDVDDLQKTADSIQPAATPKK